MGNLIRLHNSETPRREFFLILLAARFSLHSFSPLPPLSFCFPKRRNNFWNSTALRDSLQFEKCFRKIPFDKWKIFLSLPRNWSNEILREPKGIKITSAWIERLWNGLVNAWETVTVWRVSDVTSF